MLVMMSEILQIEREAALVLEREDVAHVAEEARPSVWRQPHDFVFVAIVRKAEKLRDRLIEDAERVGEVDPFGDPYVVAASNAPGGAGEVAEAVERYRHRLVEGRDVERGGEVRQMVLDRVARALEALTRESLFQELCGACPFLAVRQPVQHDSHSRPLANQEFSASPIVGAAVLVDGDVGDILQVGAGFCEAPLDRLRWKARPMLDTAEALFPRRRDQLAIGDNAGGGIGMEGVQAEYEHLRNPHPRSAAPRTR